MSKMEDLLSSVKDGEVLNAVKLNNLLKKEEEKKTEAAPEEPKPTNEEVLLAEIRDLLKNQAK